jgi:uncharacterized membrane protein
MAPPPEAAAAALQPPEPGKHRKLCVTLPGCWGALIVGCSSFTPSLLPRDGLMQGLLWGVTAAIGYGLGVLAAWIWRTLAGRPPRHPRPRSWAVFYVIGAVLTVLFFGLGQYWQHEIRQLMGLTEYNIAFVVISPLIAALVFFLLVAIGRGLRGACRRVANLLHRWIAPRAACGTASILVVGLACLLVAGLLAGGFVSIVNSLYSVRDTRTASGVRQPATGLRSGGPGSLIGWATLGYQGRNFTGTGPSAGDIGKLTGHPAIEPIRVYAGLASAPGMQARAALAVRDLQRAGGFGRKNLLVVTPDGEGWVDPALVDSFEYLSGGDCATVAIQYSDVPSWISYLENQSKARDAGRALFGAVYAAWLQLPSGHRPRLFVAGESLGSFGAEAPFSGEYDLYNRTSGALFAGPPSFSILFGEFRDHRDPGSPEVQPVYDGGRIVRFADDATRDIPPDGRPWGTHRVLYLMHPSDPVVWWSPDLIFSEPGWLEEPSGRDVLHSMFWMPLVTFCQVTADLPFAIGVPGGHGHRYTAEYVDAWNAILRPSGITPGGLAGLRTAIVGGG